VTMGPSVTLVAKLLLRDPRDEAPLHDSSPQHIEKPVKQSFVAWVTQRELRHQRKPSTARPTRQGIAALRRDGPWWYAGGGIASGVGS
jgi:hypothetical protein